jgi:hypothetical protein
MIHVTSSVRRKQRIDSLIESQKKATDRFIIKSHKCYLLFFTIQN